MNGTPSASRRTGRSLKKICSWRFFVPVETSTRLPAEDRGNEIGERLAGAGAGFGEQHAAVREDVGDGLGHLALRRRAPRSRRAPRASGPSAAKTRVDRRVGSVSRAFGIQRELPAQRLDFGLHRRRARASSSGAASARAMSSAIASISGSRMPRRRDRRRADADAARDHRRVLIERDRVLVDRDAGLAERRLGDLAGEALARRRRRASGGCRCRR